jgi:hypothetical protein
MIAWELTEVGWCWYRLLVDRVNATSCRGDGWLTTVHCGVDRDAEHLLSMAYPYRVSVRGDY